MQYLELLQRFSDPKRFSALLRNYLSKNGFRISIEKTIAGAAYYDARALPTVNTTLFDGNTTGNYTNLNSYTRPEAEHMVIWAIAISQGINATISSTAWADGATGSVTLNNGWLTLRNNGVTVLNKYDLSQAKNAITTAARGVIMLPEPIVWGGQTNCTAQIQLPAIGAANENVKVTYLGLALVS